MKLCWIFIFYSMCYYFSFWSDRVNGSIRFNLIKYLYKFNLNTELSYRVIWFDPILSCGSTNDPMVRPLTQWPSTYAKSMTEMNFKTMDVSVQNMKDFQTQITLTKGYMFSSL